MDKAMVLMLCMSFLVFRCTGRGPVNPGAAGREFTPCPGTPNCVSSREKKGSHYVEPLEYTGEAGEARERLLGVIRSMKRSRVIKSEDRYIHAEFTSAVFRFVDDAEFYIEDSSKLIHVRSASRVGRSDFGVNQKRIEEIRKRFSAAGGTRS